MDARTDPGLEPRLEALLEHMEWARGLAGRLVADAARADDVVQSALAAAAKSPPRDATNLRGWLGEVVRNAARTVGREEARRDRRERVAAKPEALEGADELVARAEMSRDLAQHVLALDEIYRDVVLLRWYEGLAPREIAKKLGVPVATVNTRLARAHGELRARLDRAYGDRSTWCVAFAPMAAMPKPALSVGAVAALSLALAALVIGSARWVGWPGTPAPMQPDNLGTPVVVGENDVGRRIGPPADAGRPALESARAESGVRTSVASAPNTASPTASSIPMLHAEGRAIGFDGRGIGGLALRARDPKLPRIADGWLRIGNQGTTIDEREAREWKTNPEALQATLAHWGNPPGLREVLLGVDLSASTTTRADGGFAIDVPGSIAAFELVDDGYALVMAGVSESYEGLVLLVAPTVRFAGSVVDEQAVPVASARLLAQGVDAAITKLPFSFEPTIYPFAAEFESDEHGHFDLDRIARFPGARVQVVVGEQYVADVEVPATDTTDVVLVARVKPVRAKPRVRGVVLDERGAGVAGAEVRMGGRNALSDESGRFDLEEENFELESEIVAIKRGFAPGWVAGIGKELREKRLVENIEIRLRGPALSITGRALDAKGEPLEDWLVSLEDTVKYPTMGIPVEFAAAGLYGNEDRPQTDGDGRFEIGGLAPQRYRIRLVDRESGIVHASDPIEAGARDVEIRLPADALRDKIRGHVVSTLGAPVAGAEIAILYPLTEGRGFSSSGYAQKTRSDSDGEFEFDDVPRRHLKLGVMGRSVRGRNFDIPDDVDPNDVVLTLTVEQRFQLEVPDEERIDGFEILDRAGRTEHVNGILAHGESQQARMPRDGADFPVCEVSEEGATIVLYSKDREVRRAPITWTGERLQVLRP